MSKQGDNRPQRVVLGVTGASGSIYAQQLLVMLSAHERVGEVVLVMSDNGKRVWNYELGALPQESAKVRFEDNHNLFADVASGSVRAMGMIIAPCSMSTLGRIAHGVGDNLICRAADVMLKERRPLVVIPREMPLSLIHIESMRQLTLAGGIVCPASPTFYGRPQNIGDAVRTVAERTLDLMGLDTPAQRWGGGLGGSQLL